MEGEPRRKATLRLGARERSRLQAAVVVIVVGLLAVGLRPTFVHVLEVRDFQSCQTNVKKIAQAITMYSQEWDEAYPLGSTWVDAVLGNLPPDSQAGFAPEHYLKCPRDRSGRASSYAYNELMGGLSQSVLRTDADAIARRRTLGRLDRAALVVEAHGSARNKATPMPDWNAVVSGMTRPHSLPEPTGSLILGSGRPWSRTEEQLAILAGKRF